MPVIQVNNIDCFYQFDDFGKSETLLFSNSLGTDHTMWNKQVEALGKYFNILRYDTRGHGQSGTGNLKEYTIDMLGSDVIAILDHLNLDKVNYCGLSMGGQLGQWLGINASNRFHKIVICNTAAKIGTADGWNTRIAHVGEHGLASITGGTAERWFTPEFNQNHADKVQAILDVFVKNPVEGYAACCAAVRDADFRDSLNKLSVPTLIVSGTEDAVTTVEDGNFFEQNIPQTSHVKFKAAHLSNVECADEFNAALIQFLND
tara:strand:- start:196 stop:978 length:783 start_codon:yes stop_codon:yes gene_type:complete